MTFRSDHPIVLMRMKYRIIRYLNTYLENPPGTFLQPQCYIQDYSSHFNINWNIFLKAVKCSVRQHLLRSDFPRAKILDFNVHERKIILRNKNGFLTPIL